MLGAVEQSGRGQGSDAAAGRPGVRRGFAGSGASWHVQLHVASSDKEVATAGLPQ